MSDRKPTSRGRQESDEMEMRSDGWDRFRRAVNAAAKSVARQSKAKQSESAADRPRSDINVHGEKRPGSAEKQKHQTHKNARLSKRS